jgi:hypothetical protein
VVTLARYLVITESEKGALPGTLTIQAATADEARDISERRRIRVRAVYAMGERPLAGSGAARGAPGQSFVSAANLLKTFGRDLRRTGDPADALRRLGAQFPTGSEVLQRAADRATPGESLTAALAPESDWLGTVPLEVIAAGERHGRVAQACEESAAVLEERRPLTLRAILLTSNLWGNLLLYLPALLIVAALAAIPMGLATAITAVGTGSLGVAWGRVRGRLPIIGELLRTISLSRFAQVFAALTRVGAPLTRSTELAVLATGDGDLIAEVMPRLSRVREGERLSTVLADCQRLPRQIVSFIATGESSGRLDNASEWLAGYLRDRSEVAVDRLSGVIAWLAPTAAGLVVLLILIASYGKYAGDLGLSVPSPGEMWHNLFHGPGGGPETP